MRNTKKAISILLTLLMVVGLMSTFAFADTKVNITIDNAKEGTTYTAYKIFDATYSGTNNAGYTINSNSPLLNAIKNIKVNDTADADSYFTVTDKVGDTTKKIVTVVNASALTGEKLASKLKAAIEALSDKEKTKLTSFSATTVDGKAEISVDPGYYYITTGNGSVVVATANAKNIEIKDKTSQPGSMTKTITNVDGVAVNKDKASAEVGDILGFKVTLNATNYQNNAEGVPQKVNSYTITDNITGNMELDGNVNVSYEPALPENNSVTSAVVKSSDNKSFTINITGWSSVNDGLDRVITVTYNAKVTGVGTAKNTANYSTNVITAPPVHPPTTEVYTYSIQINKVDGGNNNAPLKGAQFEVYTSATGGDAIKFVYNTETGIYTVATAEQIANDTVSKTTVIDMSNLSSATFNGLKNGSYYLQEIKAPDGYNLLSDRVEVKVKNYNNPEDNTSGEIAEVSATNITVRNFTGTELPSTGGIGTTIFYLIGAILVIGAGVVFVTRRRMHSDK